MDPDFTEASYTQCELIHSGNIRSVAWIPTPHAIKGSFFGYEGKEWLVSEVYSALPAIQIVMRSSEHASYRKPFEPLWAGMFWW